MNDESGLAYPATVDSLLDNAIGPKATTACSARTCTPTSGAAPGRRGDRRLGAGAQRPGDLRTSRCSTGWTGARPRRSADLSWSGGTLDVRRSTAAAARTACRRCCPCRARPGRSRDHARRLPRHVHDADDQGHPVRPLRRQPAAATPRRATEPESTDPRGVSTTVAVRHGRSTAIPSDPPRGNAVDRP